MRNKIIPSLGQILSLSLFSVIFFHNNFFGFFFGNDFLTFAQSKITKKRRKQPRKKERKILKNSAESRVKKKRSGWNSTRNPPATSRNRGLAASPTHACRPATHDPRLQQMQTRGPSKLWQASTASHSRDPHN